MSKYAMGLPDGPCCDHPCDRCTSCLDGVCCGEAVTELLLPLEGSWPASRTAVAVGDVVDGPAGLRCHACGEDYHALYAHIGVHNLSSDEYRSVFGLAATRPLASTVFREQRASLAASKPAPASYAALAAFQSQLTGEQRSLISWRRVQRAEVRSRLRAQSPAASRASVIARSDPSVNREWRAKLRARRPRAATREQGRQCPECLRWFCPINSQRVLCGEEACLRAARSRAGRAGRQRQLQRTA